MLYNFIQGLLILATIISALGTTFACLDDSWTQGLMMAIVTVMIAIAFALTIIWAGGWVG